MFEDQKQTPAPPPTGGALSYPSTSLAAMLEVPKGAARPASSTLTVHIMPKEYYGVAPKTSVKKPAALPAPKPVLPPPPPKPEKPLVPSTQIKKRRIPIVAIIGVLFVAVIALGGYLFLRSIRQPAPQPVAETPQPRSAPKPEPLPSQPSPTPAPEPIRPGIDTDSDGLTDAEERTIYGSDPRNPDTDVDSFIDGNEVFHLYDPTHPGGALLQDQALGPVTTYSDSGFAFTFLIPEAWATVSVGTPPPEPGTVNIPIASGEAMRFHTYPLSADESLATLALRIFPSETFLSTRSKQGYDMLRSATQRIAIVAFGAQTVTIEYDIGVKRSIDYLRTFEMIINSIKPLPGA